MVGAGGLGSPVVLYLAGAGIGRIDICDFDKVEESNLHRQVLYTPEDIGRSKAILASNRVETMGGMGAIFDLPFQELDMGDIKPNVILDCTDGFKSHDAVITAGLKAGIPVVHGAIRGFLGQVMTFTKGSPCWRCLNPNKPEGGEKVRGTMGPVCGVIGSMMVLEAIRVLLGWEIPKTLTVYEALKQRTYSLTVSRAGACTNCP